MHFTQLSASFFKYTFALITLLVLQACSGGNGAANNNEPGTPPVLSIASASGNEDDGAITLTLTLDNAVAGGFSVEINTADGSATLDDSDYTQLSSEVLNFTGSAGEIQTVEFLPTADTTIEADEFVTVSMANVSNATVDISATSRVDIIDDDTPTVTIADVSQNEDDGVITITAVLDNAVADGFSVEIDIADGSATLADNDYTPLSGLVLGFDGVAGEIRTFTLIPTQDTLAESDETVIITMRNVSNSAVDISDNALVTIVDDDTPTLTIGDVSGNEDGGPINLSVTLSHAVVGGFSVEVNTIDGSATLADTDYIALNAQLLSFAGTEGETQVLTVTPTPDTVVEADETLSIVMSNVSNTVVDILDTGLLSIINDDSAAITLADVQTNEDTGRVTIEAILDNAVSGGLSVVVKTADGTATLEDNDYTQISSQILNFTGIAGEKQTFTFAPTVDTVIEVDETLSLVMSDVSNTSVNITDTALITLLNDDVASISIADVSANEDDGVITLVATLSNAVSGGVSVEVSTLDGSATIADADYIELSANILSFNGNAGETQTLSLSPVTDTKVESNETLTLRMTNSSNEFVDITDTALVTITNDDLAVLLLEDASGNEDGGNISFSVTLSSAVAGGFTVEVNTADGSATVADADYTQLSSQVLSFAGVPGETRTLTLLPTADLTLEADETVSVFLSNVSNAFINISDSALITINNDDRAAITISDVSGNEDDGALSFSATLDNAVSGGFSVEVSTEDASATLTDNDYTPLLAQVLRFAGRAGETQTFSISPLADTKIEADETVNIRMAKVSVAAIDITDTAQLNIINDDSARVSIADVSGNEDSGAITLSATLDIAVAGGFSVQINTADASATLDDNDYTQVSAQVIRFSGTPGETQTFSVLPTADIRLEADETITVSMSNVSNATVVVSDTATVTIINDDIDSTAPLASISFPPQVSLTEGASVTVHGQATDTQSQITVVRVNGVDATTTDGFATWQATVALTPGSSNTLNVETGDIALNADTNAAQVSINSADLFSSNTPDALNSLVSLLDLVLDSKRNRLLILTGGDLTAIDLDNGARTVITANDAATSDTRTIIATELVIDGDTVYILDIGAFGKIISINLTNGSRSVLSVSNAVNSTSLILGRFMTLDKNRNRLLAVIPDNDSNAPLGARNLIAISLTDGARSIVASGFNNARDLVVDGANNRLMWMDFDIASSAQALMFANFDMAGNLLATNILSSNIIPNGDTPFKVTAANSLVVDENRLMIADGERILSVNLDNGSRSVISDNISSPDATNAFTSSSGSYMIFEKETNRILVSDQSLTNVDGTFVSQISIFAVQPETGARVVLSK
ncbi:hypothetical protein MNBD_GAMMA10-3320 [hydrothermal vent metagenome]|uniref:Calx-beta domain-containing protein n=1 Tax=hydrothermal vent metagenome TaxID=652676 RepID=A0A3B0Y0Q3_9ZZZZ